MENQENSNLVLGETITLGNGKVVEPSFTFSLKNEPIIIVDKTGFKYNGVLIEDAGEVYELFKDFLKKAKEHSETPIGPGTVTGDPMSTVTNT
jgi:hypothetical protein